MITRNIIVLTILLLSTCFKISASDLNKDGVLSIMEKVADWQIENFQSVRHQPLSWTNGPFYLGLNRLSMISLDNKYNNFLISVGNRNNWQLHNRENKYFADDFCVAQTFIEMYKRIGASEIIAPTIAKVNYTIENPSDFPLWLGIPRGQERWSWCDALFMAPPVYAGLYAITGNDDYIEFLDREFKVCIDSLFDRSANLFYRDRNYKNKREPNGEKVFWGRGNGWVLGGIASTLSYLPKSHPKYNIYVDIYKKLAESVLKSQNPDGYWTPSMLDLESYPDQENSATGLITYGLAWGVNNGILDESTFSEPVFKAWLSMVRCVTTEGKLGYVQKVGQKPEKIHKDSTEIFGVGAFLLAGYEVYKALEKNELRFSYQIDIAKQNGVLANEGFKRSHRYLTDWLKHADPKSGLIPRNLQSSVDLWDLKDAAADNYSYMVITSYLTDKELFNGQILNILKTEKAITSRIGNIPDEYSFSKADFHFDKPNIDKMIFGASEYIKDGLLVITELLGQSPWCDRMIEILDDLWEIAPIETKYGKLPSTDNEINGEMLQALSRIYWMTGEKKYLEYAIRLGDYYLLGDHHPTRDLDRLRLRDHGCEIVSGLTELYATVHFALPEKKEMYRKSLYEMLDRILEVGRNADGLFFDEINPKTGEIVIERIADNFGYTFNGFYTVYQLDNISKYRDIVIQALQSLDGKYRNYDWENLGVDGYADAIEGALNLYNREPVASVKNWLESEIKVMWDFQDNHPGPRGKGWGDSGIIEGMHPDGNFARTSLMYALWKTQGTRIVPWEGDVSYGATKHQDALIIYLESNEPWKGKLIFDKPRHSLGMNLPFDWPRINQFPEWFTVTENEQYEVFEIKSKKRTYVSGIELLNGIDITLDGQNQYFIVKKSGNEK